MAIDTPVSYDDTPNPSARIREMGVSNTASIVEHSYLEGLPGAFLWELVRNGFQADAKHVLFEPCWPLLDQYAEQGKPVRYPLMYVDDGVGMTGDELVEFFNHLSASGKIIALDQSFGMGAKVSMLPWNKRGVLVASWRDGRGKMIRIRHVPDPDGGMGSFGLHRFLTTDEYGDEVHEEVVDAPEDLHHEVIKRCGHGTVIVGLGNDEDEDTYLGPDGQFTVKTGTIYLNKRFLDIPTAVDLKYMEFSSTRRRNWPRRPAQIVRGGKGKNVNYRSVNGTRYYLEKYSDPQSRDTVELSGAHSGTKVHWWLLNKPVGELNIHQEAWGSSFVGAVLDGEIYNVDPRSMYHRFSKFGVLYKDVRERLVILVEAPKFHSGGGTRGVAANTARSHLIMPARGGSEDLPWDEWGHAFLELGHPAPIKEALKEATMSGPKSGRTLTERLRGYSSLLRNRAWRKAIDGDARVLLDKPGGGPTEPGTNESDEGQDGGHGGSGGGTGDDQDPDAAGGKEDPDGEPAKSVNPRMTWPKVEWHPADDLAPGRAAHYESNLNKVIVNEEFPVFLMLRDRVLDQWGHVAGAAEITWQKIEEIVEDDLASKVLHAKAMKGSENWTGDEYEQMLSDEALTLVCMGMVTYERVLGSRVGGVLGAKRPTVA